MCKSLPKLAAEQGDFRGLSATQPLPKKIISSRKGVRSLCRMY
jgi:hypothetical protein